MEKGCGIDYVLLNSFDWYQQHAHGDVEIGWGLKNVWKFWIHESWIMGERIKIPQYSDVIMVAANYFTRETLNTKLEALFAIIIILGGL